MGPGNNEPTNQNGVSDEFYLFFHIKTYFYNYISGQFLRLNIKHKHSYEFKIKVKQRKNC